MPDVCVLRSTFLLVSQNEASHVLYPRKAGDRDEPWQD